MPKIFDRVLLDIMRNWSIVTKVIIFVCTIVSILLLLGGLVLVSFEIRKDRAFVDESQRKINQSIREREHEERTLLEKNVKFNTKILSRSGAADLFYIRVEDMQETLRSYLEYPEIVAIKVSDERENPFAAAWKAPEITVDDALPEDLKLDDKLCVQAESFYEEQKVGSFQVFYTDAVIVKKINHIKEAVLADAEMFYTISRSRLINVIIGQAVGIIMILFALIICLIIFLRGLILKPLGTVLNIAHKLANFDLTANANIYKKDEIGNLLIAINGMIRSFREIVSQVQRSGFQVSSSSTELSSTAKQQEATLATQVESTSNVVKAVQEISEVTGELVQTMAQVASMSGETAEFASSGQKDLAHMQEAMEHMEQASISISGKLQAISEKANNITNVVTTITKVADQTNLLSLNAAIEAEKAGEYGRGFTVVAREIRRLADQTAVATLDIGQMVQEMQSAVSAGVMEMDKFIAEVRHSAEDVERISKQLTRIIEQVQVLSPSFEEVNIAMEQQSENAKKINTAMMNLSEETRQTKESLHETYAAIEQLNEAAKGLQNQVSLFKVS